MSEKKIINVFEPSLGPAELVAVADSFNINWAGRGAKTLRFEREWAKHIGADFNQIVSTNSCTEALFAAVKLLDIGPGDEVIIPTIHFIGAAQAVIAAGARPVFCDVDRRTLNTTLEFIQMVANPKKPKAIILNHYGGAPCSELDKIQDWCDYIDISLIEDAACAPASTYNGQAAGTFGDIGVWSFDAMKIITTGDSGMMYIRDDELAARARKLLYLGIDTENGLSDNTERWWEFGVSEPGARRSVMNDIAAGMGLEQLKRLGELVARRYEISTQYLLGLNSRDIVGCSEVYHFPIRDSISHYFFWIQTPRRDELARYLREAGIYTTFRYYPLHRAFKTGDHLPNADYAADNTLLLPLHCNLTDEQVSFICEKVREFYE